MKSTVTIVIPVYNGAKFLAGTIESALHQTYPCEVHILDDASTDESDEIIAQYEALSQVTVFKNKMNQGLAKAVNQLVASVKTEKVLVLGQDDLLLPNHVQLMLSHSFHDSTVLHCNADVIDANNKVIGLAKRDDVQISNDKNPLFHLALRNYISSCGLIFDRETFLSVGGWDEKYRNYGEWLLWIKLLSVGTISYVTTVRAKYRRHSSNLTETFRKSENKQQLLYTRECQQLAKNLLEATATLPERAKLMGYHTLQGLAGHLLSLPFARALYSVLPTRRIVNIFNQFGNGK